jgi:hypothetical protein
MLAAFHFVRIENFPRDLDHDSACIASDVFGQVRILAGRKNDRQFGISLVLLCGSTEKVMVVNAVNIALFMRISKRE